MFNHNPSALRREGLGPSPAYSLAVQVRTIERDQADQGDILRVRNACPIAWNAAVALTRMRTSPRQASDDEGQPGQLQQASRTSTVRHG